MRIVLIVACAAALAFSAWANLPSTADAKATDTSINPVILMTMTAGLPADQSDAF